MRALGFWAFALTLWGCGEPRPQEQAAGTTPTDEAVSPPEQQPTVNPFDAEQLRIALASSAKRLCSEVFVAGRSRDHVMAHELEEAAAQNLSFELSDDPRAVVGSAAGEQVMALYRPHLGCTLVEAVQVDQLIGQLDAGNFSAPAPPDPQAPWPRGSRVTLPETVQGLDLDTLGRALDEAFADPAQRTRALVVVHDGQIVAERYTEPFDADTPQLGWSMTKTVTSALTGILVGDGVLDVEAPAPVEEWRSGDDPRADIALEHLLRMSSGLEFSEVYTVGSSSDVVRMLFGRGHEDMGAFTANKPLEHPPNTHWSYASGTTNLIAKIQRETFGDLQAYFEFPQERLFAPLGIASAVIEPDVSGSFVGSSYMYATPRDWARIGLLYLQDGMWNGERILPEGWVEYSLTPAPAAGDGQYGAQIWLNRGRADDANSRPHPDLPAETFYLSGFEGQNVVVVPSARLVVVRMGLTRNGPSPVWPLTRRILDILAGS